MEETAQALPEDLYYEIDDLVRYECDTENGEIINSGAFAFSSACGLDCEKRNNVHVLDDEGKVALTTVGNVALLLCFKQHPVSVKYVFGVDSSGIGTCCVHPEKRYFALGGKGMSPSIYIYEYPSLRLHRILRGGTENAYSCLAFNKQGNKLASVGAYPDFLLTVWDWPQERMILRNKAFAQEVYNVCFSPNSDGFLTTSGLGHIRFWQMASTFTGIKLQGSIGKFGKVELSDIAAYAVLPDGKVLSGSESGSLLLWEGNFIKLELRRPNELLPHEGEVHICQLLPTSPPQLLTGGEDGYLRWWSVSAIDLAELSDDSTFFTLEPLREESLSGVVPKSISMGTGYFVVQSARGGIHVINDVPSQEKKIDSLMASHAGPITSMDTSPSEPFVASCGRDQSVKVWNYSTNELTREQQFNTAGVVLKWSPKSVSPTGKTLVVGFEDGVLRLLGISTDEIKLIAAFKPHNGCINALAYSPCGGYLATAGTDATVFLFKVESSTEYTPLGFVEIPNQQGVHCLCWQDDAKALLIGANFGRVYRLQFGPDLLEHRESESFLLNIQMDTHTFERPKIEQVEEEEGAEEEEEVSEEPIGNTTHILCTAKGDGFYLCLDGADTGIVYECTFGTPFPVTDTTFGSIRPEVTTMDYNDDKSFLLTGSADGSVFVQSTTNLKQFERVWMHEGTVAGARLSHDKCYLVSAGSEGGLFVHRFDSEAFCNFAPEAQVENRRKPLPCDMAAPAVAEKFASQTPQETNDDFGEVPTVQGDDITDPEAYSIQDDKLKTEEDNRKRLAELKKSKIREAVSVLQEEFRKLYEENKQDIEGQQLPESAFRIDPGIEERLRAEHNARIDEVYKEFEWDTVMLEKQLAKLKVHYLDDLLVETIKVHAFQSSASVTSFRVRKFKKETRK